MLVLAAVLGAVYMVGYGLMAVLQALTLGLTWLVREVTR